LKKLLRIDPIVGARGGSAGKNDDKSGNPSASRMGHV
jgi:hypothetical protein